jgi:hypothetical protein
VHQIGQHTAEEVLYGANMLHNEPHAPKMFIFGADLHLVGRSALETALFGADLHQDDHHVTRRCFTGCKRAPV